MVEPLPDRRHGVVGGVQLPEVRPGSVHGGTVISVTLAKRPVVRRSSATSDALAAVMLGAKVNDWVSVVPDPLGIHEALWLPKIVR